jgi:hypothetical protein
MMTAGRAVKLALLDRWKKTLKSGIAVLAGRNDGVGLTNGANRPRLHRDDERSRGSKKLRESGRQCRRGPS